MVMAQSLYKLLRERDPGALIDVVAPAWSLPILARMDEVRRGVELSVLHGEAGLSKRYELGRALRAEAYTQAIVLPRSWKSALVPYFARVPHRTGFRGEWRYGLINDMRRLDRARLDQTVKRFLALGLARDEDGLPSAPRPRLRVDPATQSATLARLGLEPSGNDVALLPGAEYGPAKQWPVEHFADLAGRLGRVGVNVWILGSAKERLLGEAIREAAAYHSVRNLCGETTLEEAIDVLGAVRVAVSNDSGLMHVAAAVGAFVVALYGSSSPALTPPLTERRHIFYLDLDCSPCFERNCPLGHLRCLREITCDDVCSMVVTVLGEPRPTQEALARN